MAPFVIGIKGGFHRAFTAYTRALRSKPVTTQVITTGLLWGIGDAFAQRLEGHQFNQQRLLLSAAYGGACVGPLGHFWYLGLDRAARALFRPGGTAFIAAKVAADTLVFGPFHVVGYFVAMQLGLGGSLHDAAHKVSVDFLPTFLAECAYWPAFQVLNFLRVPVEFQLLAVNCATVVDSSFMSWCRATDDWSAVLREKLMPGTKR